MTARLALGMVLASGLSACGSPPLSQEGIRRIENDIRARVDARIPGNQLRVRSVECPGEIKRRRGERFACRMTLSDGRARDVQATQINERGGVEWMLEGG